MMKRKAVSLLLGGIITIGACASSAQAMTYAYSTEAGNGGSVTYVIRGSEEEQESASGEEDVAVYDYNALSEENQEEFYFSLQGEIGDQIADLEDYGVTYDAENGVIYYQGKSVRYLIDAQSDDVCMMIRMSEGEIDVYTQRDENGKLSGVRTATEDEYDAQTKRDEAAAEAESVTAANVYGPVEDEEYGTYVLAFDSDGDTGESSIAGTYRLTVDAADDVSVEYSTDGDDAAEETTAEGTVIISFDEGAEKREAYAAHGIGYDETEGSWLWQDKAVCYLMDEDGSVYQNGSQEAKENRIYLLVKRDSDGNIEEVKQITAEDVVKEKIIRDLETED